jgi:Bacteriophage tail sheath protein
MATYDYHGVHIEEVKSSVRTITGVATSMTAFVGPALRGPVNDPVRVQSFAGSTRQFGGLWKDTTMSYAVSHFSPQSGTDALVARVFNGDVATNSATLTLGTASGDLALEAASPGGWSAALRATVDHQSNDTSDVLLSSLTIEELDKPAGATVCTTNEAQVLKGGNIMVPGETSGTGSD